jgi:salicylate hydroxylase
MRGRRLEAPLVALPAQHLVRSGAPQSRVYVASARNEMPFLISGGGIGGLAAALALARRGRRSVVLEQAHAFGEVGAGIQLGPNVFHMFDALGLMEAVQRLCVFPEDLIMRDCSSGAEIARIAAGHPEFKARYRYPYAVIYRPDLHHVLLEACRASPLISLRTDQKVIICDDDGKRVQIRTEAGAQYEGCALIGADGLWSKVREYVVGDGPPRVSGHIAYRAVLPAAEIEERLRPNAVILWAGAKMHFVQYPLRRGELFNLVAVFHSDRYEEGWNIYGDPAELESRFRHAHAQVQTLLARIDAWKMWVLCDRDPVKHWSKGNVTLLGDAAHPMLQYLAQGACMAIEDAVVLAARIEDHGANYAAAFTAYQEQRYLRTGRVQLTARFFGELYHAEGVKAEIRNQMFKDNRSKPEGEGMAWLYDGVKL